MAHDCYLGLAVKIKCTITLHLKQHFACAAKKCKLQFIKITSRNAHFRRAYLLWRILCQAVKHQLHMHGVSN